MSSCMLGDVDTQESSMSTCWDLGDHHTKGQRYIHPAPQTLLPASYGYSWGQERQLI